MSQNNLFKLENSEHKYRTEIPNIVFDLFLKPIEFALYSLFKRIAGDDGVCFASNDFLCTHFEISEPTLIKHRKSLEQPRELLGGTSLINCLEQKDENGGNRPNSITINDIWPVNMNYMYEKNKNKKEGKIVYIEPGSKFEGGGVKNFKQGGLNNLSRGGKKFLPKEEPIYKKNHIEEEYHHHLNPPPSSKSESKSQKKFSQSTQHNIDKKSSLQTPNSLDFPPIEDGGGGGFLKSKQAQSKGKTMSVKYITPLGKEKEVSDSEIFRYFLKHPFATELIEKAILEASEQFHQKKPISDIFKYLEAICLRLQKQQQTIPVKEKPEEKKYAYESIPKNTEKGVGWTDEQLAELGIKPRKKHG